MNWNGKPRRKRHNMNIEGRIKKLEQSRLAGEHKTMERLIEQIDLEARKDLTTAESARLRHLKALPVEPRLRRTIESIIDTDGGGAVCR
jgi:hypothetical protein